ncbi:MAG: hypothetical protein WC498_01730 [Candidatus Saccharimonadales bacterium]
MYIYRPGGKRYVDSIVQPVRDLGFPKGELIVVGGAALQFFGIKQTNDIDVVIRSELMLDIVSLEENRQKRYQHFGRIGMQLTVDAPDVGQVLAEGDEYSAARRGNISFMLPPNDHLYAATFEELSERSVSLRGIQILTPDAVREWKQGVQRPKDLEDISLIDAYLDRVAS